MYHYMFTYCMGVGVGVSERAGMGARMYVSVCLHDDH